MGWDGGERGRGREAPQSTPLFLFLLPPLVSDACQKRCSISLATVLYVLRTHLHYLFDQKVEDMIVKSRLNYGFYL